MLIDFIAIACFWTANLLLFQLTAKYLYAFLHNSCSRSEKKTDKSLIVEGNCCEGAKIE